MTDLDQRLRRALLTAVQDQPAPVLPSGADYRAAVRRRWPAMPAAAAAAAVVLVIGAVIVVLGRGPSGVPAPAGGVAAWPPRGSLAGNVALTNAAMRTWEAALLPHRELPHSDVTVLYAEHTIAGNVVVLTGVDALGHRRIAEFDTDATSTTAFRHRLHLVADLLAPTGDAAGLIAIDAPRDTPRKSNDDLLVVLAPPATKLLEWRDQMHHWQPLPAVNGAAALVHVENTLSTSVRAGRDGDGVQTMGRFYPFGAIGSEIVHDLDPGETLGPPARAGTESCDGNTCSVTAGGSMTVEANPKGNWHSLLDSRPVTARDWVEFGGEAQLYADTFIPNDGNTFTTTWSGVLPDETGIYLEFFKPGNDPIHLLVYVDRPEWYGGSVVDLVPSDGQLSALAVEVPTPRGRTLDIVVTDGVTPQWRTGTGAWHSMAVRDNVATAVVPSGVPLSWRAVDGTGAVVASGAPHAVSPR